ncbi:MAG: methionine synthase [Sphaerospermopsis sp. SIO1G2]|nr:methionine synthase [Sphaerospermopsis sp. SIO1G1]NET73306.1 methionine synthase [Sphaerospermopsis sp. SIO1G2]
MKRGIYILANDKVIDQTLALINSIRFYDQETPIVMIPYNDDYHKLEDLFTHFSNITVFENLDLINYFSEQITKICGKDLLDRPNLLRKLVCWFGPLDEFLYIDTDIVVFNKIADNLNYLAEYDFICYDYQHSGGIDQVFNPAIQENNIFSEDELKGVFNSGFWISRKGIVSEDNIWEVFQDCTRYPEYFYLLNSDQTILNYLILKYVPRHFNIARGMEKVPGNWGGSSHFQIKDNILIDSQLKQPLQFIHWAGIKIKPGCPYWEIWDYYRSLNPNLPTYIPPQPVKQSFLRKTLRNIKNKLKL